MSKNDFIVNGGSPAMPLPITNIDGGGVIDTSEYSSFNSGLTKREHFASMAMQGIMSGTMSKADGSNITGADLSMIAVQAADALLAALEDKQ